MTTNHPSETFAGVSLITPDMARAWCRRMQTAMSLIGRGYGTVNGRFIDRRPITKRYPMDVQIKGPRSIR